MSDKFKAFSKIEQFRNIVKQVRDYCSYHSAPLPAIIFDGTVKLHGTNAAVGFKDGEIFCQSRSRIITPEDDNFGFANFVESNKDYFQHLINMTCADFGMEDIIIYGEWCGGNIQKGVALSELDKMFVIFRVEDLCTGNTADLYQMDTYKGFYHHIPVYVSTEFMCFMVAVDFANPEDAVKGLIELTEDVEKCCPVAYEFDVEGVGEGIVWTGQLGDKELIFKVKGEKHSVSKVKKLATVNPEVVKSVQNFVEYAVTTNRLEQGLQEVGLDQKNIGKFIGWVNKDIHKEEQDVLEANNLTMKQVAGKIADKSRAFYLERLNAV